MNEDKFFRIITLACLFFSFLAAVEGFYLIKAIVKVGHLIMGV